MNLSHHTYPVPVLFHRGIFHTHPLSRPVPLVYFEHQHVADLVAIALLLGRI